MGVDKQTNSERTLVGARITIYARGKRRIYYADYHHNGEHCRRSLRTTNKKVAIRRARQLDQDLDEGTLPDTRPNLPKKCKTITLVQAALDFVEYSRTEGRRRRTITKQRGILDRFIEVASASGVEDLTDVSLLLIDQFRSKRKKKLSATSMTNDGRLLRQFLAWCAERQLIGENPLAGKKFCPPKHEPREGPALEQINAILTSASAVRRPVLATLAFTGARSGEVAHLLVEDVDLDGNWLHFVSRPGLETKSGNTRKVPIHERLRPVLEAATGTRKSGWLFTALPSRKYPKGDHHISTKHVNEDLLEVLKSLKLPAGRVGGFTVHSLRRSFKTICVNANIPREVVDAWQDHAHVRTPGDLYYKLSDADSQRFMKLVPFGEADLDERLAGTREC